MRSITNFLFTAFSNLRNGAEKLNRSDADKNSVKNRETASANAAPAPQPKASTSKLVMKGEPPVTSGADTRATRSTTRLKVSTRPEAVAQPPAPQEESRQFNRAQTQARNEVGELILLMRKRVADDDNYKEKSAELFAKALEKYGNTSEIWDSDLFAVLITMRHWNLAKIALDHGAGTYIKDHAPTVADEVTKRLQAEIDTIKKELADHISNPLGLVKARSHTRKGEDALRVLRRNRAQWKAWVGEHIGQPTPGAPSRPAVPIQKTSAHGGTPPQEPARLERKLQRQRLSSRQEKTLFAYREERPGKLRAKAAVVRPSPRSHAVPTHARDKSTAVASEPHSVAGTPVFRTKHFLNNHKAASVSVLDTPLVITEAPSFPQHSAPSVAKTNLLTEADAVDLFRLAHGKALQGSVTPDLSHALTTFLEGHGMKLVQTLLGEYHQQLAQEGRIGAGDALTMLNDSQGIKQFDAQRRMVLSAMHGAQRAEHDQTSKGQFRKAFSSRANAFEKTLVAEIRARENARGELSKKMGEITVYLPEIFNKQRPIWIPRARQAKPPPIPRSNIDSVDGTSKYVASQPTTTPVRAALEQEVTRARKTLHSAFRQTARKNVYAPLDNIRDDLEFYFNVILPTAVRRTPLLGGQKLTEANWGKALETVWGVLDGAYQNQLILHQLRSRKGVAPPSDLQALVTAGSKIANNAEQHQIHVKVARNVGNLPYPLEDVASEFVLKIIRSRLEQAPQAVEIRLDERMHQELLHALSRDVQAADATFIPATYQVMTDEQRRLIRAHELTASEGQDTNQEITRARPELQSKARAFVQQVIREQAVTPQNLQKINQAIEAYCAVCRKHFDDIVSKSYSEIFKSFHLPIDETPIEERFDIQS